MPDYEELYNRVVANTGWTYDYIDSLPYPRFFMACRMDPPMVRMMA